MMAEQGEKNRQGRYLKKKGNMKNLLIIFNNVIKFRLHRYLNYGNNYAVITGRSEK